jgi:hypothetical protein
MSAGRDDLGANPETIHLAVKSASDLAIWHSSRLNNCLTRLAQEKRVSRYPSADENG